MTRLRRRLGTALLVLGVLFLAYGATVYLWRDPVTDLWARWKQHQLADDLERSFQKYQASAGLLPSTTDPTLGETAASTNPPAAEEPAPGDPVAEGPPAAELEQTVRKLAEAYFRELEDGQPIGRIVIPKLDVHPIFVNGTSWGADLSRGPGRYPQSFLPGMGKVTAIAGHRTTFGAWFRHIDDLTSGDEITLQLAYGTFHYRVFGHEIVDNGDWSVLEPRGFDTLVLSACHPLYSAAQRWIVYARLVSVELPDGESFDLPIADEVAAAPSTSG